MTGDTTKHVVIHRTGLHLHFDTVLGRWLFKDSYDSNLQIASFIWYCSEDDGLFHDMTQLVYTIVLMECLLFVSTASMDLSQASTVLSTT